MVKNSVETVRESRDEMNSKKIVLPLLEVVVVLKNTESFFLYFLCFNRAEFRVWIR